MVEKTTTESEENPGDQISPVPVALVAKIQIEGKDILSLVADNKRQ